MRYSPTIARWIGERESGELDPEGGLVVTHRVADSHWPVRHVLQHGPDAEVLGPVEARGGCATRLQRWPPLEGSSHPPQQER